MPRSPLPANNQSIRLRVSARTLYPILGAIFVFIGANTQAEFVLLGPAADTSIFEAFPENNMGGNDNMVAGANASLARARALFRFDVAGAIPSNAIIQSVTLVVTVVLTPPDGGEPSTFDLRRVLVDWGEGTGTNNAGVSVTSGEADWAARFYPSNLWSVPGGAVSNDFSEMVSASLALADLGNYTFNSTSNLVSDAQSWLREPGKNFGWVLMSESENVALTVRRIGTRESITNAPLLRVDFSMPNTPEIQIKQMAGGVELSFLASGGQHYTLQFRNSLTSGTWETLTTMEPSNITTNVSVFDPYGANGQRFYRVGLF
jgi:hypothetical protein